MKNIVFFLILLLCVSGYLRSQGLVEDFYLKVEKKLLVDKKYLNLYSVSFQPTAEEASQLSNIPKVHGGRTASLISKEGVMYSIVILKENLELDSLVLLAVKKIEDKAAASDKFFGDASSGPQIDTTVVLSFSDLQELYFTNSNFYNQLYAVTERKLKEEDPASMLSIRIGDKSTKSKGITSIDNTDYLNDNRANSIHRFPKPTGDELKKIAPRRRGAAAEVSSESEFSIDASFSHVSFYHKQMDFGFSSLSAEVNTSARALNMIPWEPMTLTMGVRSLLSISQIANTQNLKNDFILDAKLMGRMRLNTSKLIGKLPFIFGPKPILNVGPGFILDISGTKGYELPFFNFYLSVGSEDATKPYVSIGKPDTSLAYFSFKQWESSMYFYWNSSEDRTLRYRLEVGMGNYDVYKANYLNSVLAGSKMIFNKIHPIVGLQLNFAPQNIDFLSLSSRFYDGKLSLHVWMKLLEFADGHVFRLETYYVSAPMFRVKYSWEPIEGSSLVQLRYRYAL